jgi:plastocyanin
MNPVSTSLRRVALLAALAAALSRSASATTFTVTVAPGFLNTFSPSSLTINVGDTVTWVWAGPAHSTTSGNPCTADGNWDSGVQNDPFSFSFTFASAGTYPYFCTVHCSVGMTGEIIVQEPTPPPTVTAPSPTPPTTPTVPLPTSTAPAPTATVIAPGTVPTLSPWMLVLLGLALGGAALLLIKRS